MTRSLHQAQDLKWGIERETHRIMPDGTLSNCVHPENLKAPSFTRDFAESQLELVTGVHASIESMVTELESLTEIAQNSIGSELLLPFSMPSLVGAAGSIRIARMGEGEQAHLAERYRGGLLARYGLERQLICGVHLNVSMGEGLLGELQGRTPLVPEEIAAGGSVERRKIRDGYYVRLVRNLFDDMPFFVMLFGATPFNPAELDSKPGAAYSVRNSPKGYARGEYRPFLDLGSLAGHIAGIRRGMATESARFKKLGLIRDGRPVQINSRVFQREKEFYAPNRFKRIPLNGESALDALERRGVEYVELRFFDVDPFIPTGISKEALQLAHLFILDNLMKPSVSITRSQLDQRLHDADEAALSNPFLTASKNNYLDGVLKRLTSLEDLAAGMGPDYEQALTFFRNTFKKPGGPLSASIARDFIESNLDWDSYIASAAQRHKQGALYGITA